MNNEGVSVVRSSLFVLHCSFFIVHFFLRALSSVQFIPGPPVTEILSRHVWTALTDAQLLVQCEVDTYRASGPGGQKRNKTSSAVRLRHPPSGLILIGEGRPPPR